jgi:uncharacterized RDD family membrane protein YckC
MDAGNQQYVGFWARFVAVIVNSIILGAICYVLMLVLGIELDASRPLEELEAAMRQVQLLNALCGLVFFIGIWVLTQTDPGKMIFGAVIVDAKTGEKPSTLKFVLRYLGYIVSTIPLCLGFIWVAFDARKQGFHDKIAGTVVVRK